jgi:hypothetical protein
MRFASTSSSIMADGTGPALAGAVCAAAEASHHSSATAAADVKRIMQFLPECGIAGWTNARPAYGSAAGRLLAVLSLPLWQA